MYYSKKGAFTPLFILYIMVAHTQAMQQSYERTFFQDTISSNCISHCEKITCSVQDNNVGFIHFRKIGDNFLLYTLFVYPDYRHQGNGTALIAYAIDRIKKIYRPKKIFIYAYPFEYKNDTMVVDDAQHLQRAQKLVEFYKTFGFKQASCPWNHTIKTILRVKGFHMPIEHILVMDFQKK